MADPSNLNPEAVSSPAPVAASPEPVAPAPASAAPVVEAPAAAPEPAPAAVVEPEAPKAVEPAPSEPTLLEAFDKDAAAKAKAAEPPKVDPAKPAEAAKPEDAAAKPAEAPKPVEAAPEPVAPIEYKWELPEALKADDAKLAAFSGILNEAKLPAELGTETGQKLLTMHAEAMQDYATHVAREQHRLFDVTRQGWRTEVMADPEIGGAGHQTAMTAIARMRDLGVPERRRAGFEQMLRVTGVGDHPEFLLMLHEFARIFDEPGLPPPNAKPTPNNGRPAPRRLRDNYNSHTNGNGRS